MQTIKLGTGSALHASDPHYAVPSRCGLGPSVRGIGLLLALLDMDTHQHPDNSIISVEVARNYLYLEHNAL